MTAGEVDTTFNLCTRILNFGKKEPFKIKSFAAAENHVQRILEYNNQWQEHEWQVGELQAAISEENAKKTGGWIRSAMAVLEKASTGEALGAVRLMRVVNSSGVSFREHPQLDAKAQAINGRPTPGLSYCDLVTVCGEPVEGPDGNDWLRCGCGTRELWMPIAVGKNAIL